jgi:hypothetical protein
VLGAQSTLEFLQDLPRWFTSGHYRGDDFSVKVEIVRVKRFAAPDLLLRIVVVFGASARAVQCSANPSIELEITG